MNKEIEYCPRCELEFKMAQNPDTSWSITMPPHDPRCPKIAPSRPAPLEPLPHD